LIAISKWLRTERERGEDWLVRGSVSELADAFAKREVNRDAGVHVTRRHKQLVMICGRDFACKGKYYHGNDGIYRPRIKMHFSASILFMPRFGLNQMISFPTMSSTVCLPRIAPHHNHHARTTMTKPPFPLQIHDDEPRPVMTLWHDGGDMVARWWWTLKLFHPSLRCLSCFIRCQDE